MEPAEEVSQMVGRVSDLLGARLGAKGHSLGERLESRSRRLPAKVRRSVETLAAMEARMASPRLARQIDLREARRAYDRATRYLGPLGRGGRLSGWALNAAATLALAALVLGAIFLYLRLRGSV